MGIITKYATTLEQISDVRFGQNNWSNLENGVGNTNVATTSSYTTAFAPKQLYAHDFGITLPEQYSIDSVTFDVKIKGGIKNTKVPTAFFIFRSIGRHTDFDYGDAFYYAKPDTNISESYNIVSYSISKDDLKNYVPNMSFIQTDSFGTILKFSDSDHIGGISIEWIRVTIKYSEPEYICEIRGHTTSNEWEAPYLYKYKVGSVFSVLFYVHNPIDFKSNPKDVYIDIPLGLRIMQYEESEGATFNPNTKTLHLDWSRMGSPYVKIYFFATTVGTKKLRIVGDSKVGTATRYLYIEKSTFADKGDESVIISSTDVRKCEYCEFYLALRVLSLDETAGFDFHLHDMGRNDTTFISMGLDESRTSEGVSIDESQSTESYVLFNVPAGKEVDIYLTIKFLPDFTGNKTFVLEANDTGDVYEYDYVCHEPYRYVITPKYDNCKDIVFTNCRIVSRVDTGAYVYPMAVSEFDNPLVMDKSTLRLTKFNDIDYIGCVALEQTHFNPKSTYKDTLLNTTYKNKTYMGKKGSIDETINLNVRLHPKDVTTMQGLVAMDKPIPINANHLCFEGDALNHRGWAELYGITAEETNPHWYKCQLSVKYITHNLNTRFSINKGSNISDYFLPSLMEDVCNYGSDLTENFFIETDGGYYYNQSIEDYHLRNMFMLDNSDRFKIIGMKNLGIQSEIDFNWYSSRNYEAQDNNMSRIIRLIDAETENAVMEYEWYDIDYSRTNEYSCRVICRILHKGSYKTILNRNLILNRDIENSGGSTETALYGSELILKIIGDKLSIQDCGFGGKELFIEDIDLQNGMYYFETEFVNTNIDFDAQPIGNWIDIGVKELDYDSQYSEYYKNLLVSPFPVPSKKVVFMRESEEGTIFYLLDDGEDFTYMINPYFQYHCGVDLQTADGISIFNLDNNYIMVYITNGLVKLGINRYNGKMTLAKYDKASKTYVTTTRLQLTKYDDININSFTDDKLQMQVSDTVITMWRGHPYVCIEHENEDILLLDDLTKVYANGVGNKTSDIPVLYRLIDNTNLLPSCIASDRKIDVDCFTVTEEEVADPSTNVAIEMHENNGMASPSIIYADCPYPFDGMKFVIDGRLFDGTLPQTGDVDSFTHKIEHLFTEEGTHTIKAVYWKGANYYFSPTISVYIEDNTYKITPTFPSKMYLREKDFTCTLTYGGEPVEGETIVFYVNGLSYTRTTDSEGKVSLNNGLTHPDTYEVVMTYSEGGELLAEAIKETTIVKAYANIDLYSSDYIDDPTSPKQTVTKGGYVIVHMTNNLDPNDDDVTVEETYLTNEQIVITVNGRDYIRKTDENGNARLNINLSKGTYDIRITYAGSYQYYGNIKNFELRVIEQ